MNDFYVYAYYGPDVDPEYGPPFYVGKGRGKRASAHLAACLRQHGPDYGSLFYRKLRKMLAAGVRPEIEIVVDHLTEDAAFAFERDLVRGIGRRNLGRAPLCNLTNGGDGASGHIVSDEVRACLRAKHLGKVLSAEHRRKLGAARRGRQLSATTRHRIGVKRRGKRHSEETRQRLRLHLRGKRHTEETRRKMSENHRRRPVDALDATGSLVYQFDSIKAVAGSGYLRSCVSNCLAGRQATHKGLRWRYNDA